MKQKTKLKTYEIIKNLQPFKKGPGTRMTPESEKILALLKKVQVGDAFLIPAKKKGTVRQLIERFKDQFKDYSFILRTDREDKDLVGVFRVETEKQGRVQKILKPAKKKRNK